MRVLLASTAGSGHVGPLLAFGRVLEAGGDEVLFVVPAELATRLEDSGHRVAVADDPDPAVVGPLWERFGQADRAEQSEIVEREIFARHTTAAALPAMEAAAASFDPQLVVREPCEYAAAIVADRCGLPQAQVGISFSRSEARVLEFVTPVLDERAPGLAARLAAAPYLTGFPASIDPAGFSATYRFRAEPPAPPAPLPDWWGGRSGPLVYATLGTVVGGFEEAAFVYDEMIRALGRLPVRALVTLGRSGDPASFADLPQNVHVERFVPQADVLAEAAAVCCHGGSGTTFAALSAGVPLVFVPFFADQPENARRVAATGAGLVVGGGEEAGGLPRFGDDLAGRLEAAVLEVLHGPGFTEAARGFRDEMASMPGIAEVLTALASDLGLVAEHGFGSGRSDAVTIRRLVPEDWELLRAIRLRALSEDPDAFGSTFAREVAFEEETWRSRALSSTQFVAETGGVASGIAAAFPPPEGPGTFELVGMWVAPEARRRKLGARLVEAVLDLAREQGIGSVNLWVAGGNEAAAALYRSVGFEVTGEQQPLPSRPENCEDRMTYRLDRPVV